MTYVRVTGTGEIRPDWLVKLEEALEEAKESGWEQMYTIVMEHNDGPIWRVLKK